MNKIKVIPNKVSIKPIFHLVTFFARREARTRIRHRDWLKFAGEKILREQVGTVPIFFCSREQSRQVENRLIGPFIRGKISRDLSRLIFPRQRDSLRDKGLIPRQRNSLREPVYAKYRWLHMNNSIEFTLCDKKFRFASE